MTQQQNIWGTFDTVGEHTAEAQRIVEKYPRSIEEPGLFLFNVLKERCPWVVQLEEQKQYSLRELFRDSMSLNRRRQEIRENIPT